MNLSLMQTCRAVEWVPKSEVYNRMWSVLDEDNTIGAKDDLLYKLSRAEKERDLTETEISVTGISNYLSFRDKLDPRVQSSLCKRNSPRTTPVNSKPSCAIGPTTAS